MSRENIHPEYFETEITCITCNNHFMSGSTKGKEIRVDTCSNCHPFYTGKQNFVAAKGRVERFLTKAKKQVEVKPKEKSEAKKASNSKVLSLDSFKTDNKKNNKPAKKTEKE